MPVCLKINKELKTAVVEVDEATYNRLVEVAKLIAKTLYSEYINDEELRILNDAYLRLEVHIAGVSFAVPIEKMNKITLDNWLKE